jgi:hypothetical protein
VCLVDQDCAGHTGTPFCQNATRCVQCASKNDCAVGQRCMDGACR